MLQKKNALLCLNDQGGERMDVLFDKTATLRAEAHYPPVIIENHPADSRIRITDVFQTLSGRMGTGGAMYRWLWRKKWTI